MDSYIKLRVLGEGAYGRVFLMREKKPPGRLVCVKVLHESASAAVSQNEIRVMKRVRHPNVIRLFDAFPATKVVVQRRHSLQQQQQQHQHRARPSAIVMEFCSGGDFRAFLRQLASRTTTASSNRPLIAASRMHEDRVWYWFLQLCLALQHLHDDHRILHRDLKTSNLFLTNSGFVVLGDFGVARECMTTRCGSNDQNVDAIGGGGGGVQASTLIGTPLYMAPEMWDGHKYSTGCDLWALGCVLYEMCMGHPPFEATSTAALIRKICSGEFTMLPADRWSPRLREVVAKLLSVDPRARPSAATLLQQRENAIHLRRYLQDRRAAAARGGKAALTEDEAGEQAILLAQLTALGINLDLGSVRVASEPLSAPDSPRSHAVESHEPNDKKPHDGAAGEAQERMFSAMREQERQEQLRIALRRLQEMRLGNSPPLPPVHSDGVDQEKAHARRDSPMVTANAMDPASGRILPPAVRGGTRNHEHDDVTWQAPVQVAPRPRSSQLHRARKDMPLTSRASMVEFTGIPRQGVPLTAQAKEFAAKSKQRICCDIRELRHNETVKAAQRYRQTLDVRFNSKPISLVTPAASSPLVRARDRPAVADKSRHDDECDVAALDYCIAELEASLRARLGD